MLSAGLRIGAVPLLRIKHLENMEKYGIYKVTVYADSKRDNYITFTRPEATKAIDDYLKSRNIKGEKLRPDSPLFRKEFDSKYANVDIELITKSGLFKLIQELAVNIGKRTLGHKAKAGYAPSHDTPLTHSFRKLSNTVLVKAGVKPIVVEKLLGHNIGLQADYLRLSDEDFLEEYVKAVDLLTVSEAKFLQKQVEKLKTEVSDIDMMKKMYLDMKLQLERERQERIQLYETLYLQGIINKED